MNSYNSPFLRGRSTWISVLLILMSVGLWGQQPTSLVRGTAEAFSATTFEAMQAWEVAHPDAVLSLPIKRPNPELLTPLFNVLPDNILSVEQSLTSPAGMLRETSPLPDTGFLGLYDTGNSIPPDVNGAPGLEHLMVTLNTQVRIQSRSGLDMGTVYLETFWNSLPGSGTFDPKILYDHAENRWIFVTCAGSSPGNSRIYLGVSATSNPKGAWYLYSFLADPQNIVWFDYPSMGFNSRWIVVSGNMFGNDFYSTVYVFDKQAMYAGLPQPGFSRFATNDGFTLVPAITFDQDEQDIYLISSANGNIQGMGYITLFKVYGATESPLFQMLGNIGTPNPWAGYVGNNGDFLPQLGSNYLINAVDHRMQNVVLRNGKLWAVHHVFLPANNPQRTAVQWWNLSRQGEVLQRGRIDDPTGLMHYAFPTIAVNQFEDMMIGHNIFSLSQYPSAGYSFKAHFDPPNTTRSPYQYKDGLAPYYKTFGSGRNRWGDYSATMLDPRNGVDFWVLQEYAELPVGGDRWSTWWAYVRIPFFPEPDFAASLQLIPTGESVDFTDLSAGVPSEWSWTFEGGVPATSSDQHPKNIHYPNPGVFTVSLTVSNIFGSNTITRTQYVDVSSSLLPEVAFNAQKKLICTGEPVAFTDQSIHVPRQWLWEFTPSTVSFVDGTDQNSQHPRVVFNEPGNYSVTLHATNLNGTSTSTAFDLIKAGGAPTPYIQRFDAGTFADVEWQVVNPDNQKTWELYPVGGLQDITQAARLDFFTYYAIGQRDRLISPPLDLRNATQVSLNFRHAHAKRLAQVADSLIVYVSGNCGLSWTRIFAAAENGSGNFATHPMVQGFVPAQPDDWCGSGWGAPCITLPLAAWEGLPNVKVAFETYSFYGNPLYVADITVEGLVRVADNPIEQAPVLQVVPNPSVQIIRLLFDGEYALEQLKIRDIYGREVHTYARVVSGQEIRLPELPAGIYLLQAEAGGRTVSARMVIR
ncbi:MAG: PKD domain-containing protein [Bacteroidetes bacterium]|nr:PKD domain-containing protein [Bacteroidota bacterium]